MEIGIIIGVIVVILFIIFLQYNSIVKLRLKIEQSKSGIDVYCQQRFDLIPNLIEIVKGYMNYEEKTLKEIADLRNQFVNTKDLKIGEELNRKMSTIIAIAENYPELKASEQFLNLQKNLEKVESQLQAARRIYNTDVTNYNTKINMIPFNIVAKMFGFENAVLFEVKEEKSKDNINVEL